MQRSLARTTRNPSLLTCIREHKNDYGFDPLNAITSQLTTVPSLSVIIPYFEVGALINLTLHHLYNALRKTQEVFPDWTFEVLLLDDGSQVNSVLSIIANPDEDNLEIISIKENQGRSRTRNEGLLRARHELCLFLDADILVDSMQILNCVKLHSINRLHNQNRCIAVAFFQNVSASHEILPIGILQPEMVLINDFRVYCIYDESWIGDTSDKEFVSQEFHLVRSTNSFRDWRGKIGPWYLTNMVLGGFFMVDRQSSLAVNGFDLMFNSYGFTETTLVTKLIAAFGQFVMPQRAGGALHCLNHPAHYDQATRNKYFRRAHQLYSTEYLSFGVMESVEHPLRGWGK